MLTVMATMAGISGVSKRPLTFDLDDPEPGEGLLGLSKRRVTAVVKGYDAKGSLVIDDDADDEDEDISAPMDAQWSTGSDIDETESGASMDPMSEIPNFAKRRRTMLMTQIPSNLREQDLLDCNLKVCTYKYNLGQNVFVDRPFHTPYPSIRIALWTSGNSTPGCLLGPSPTYTIILDSGMISILKDSVAELSSALNSSAKSTFGGFLINLGKMFYVCIDRGQTRATFRKWWIRKDDEYKNRQLNPCMQGLHLDRSQVQKLVMVLNEKLNMLVPEITKFDVSCDEGDAKHSKSCVVCHPKGKLPVQLFMEKLHALSVRNFSLG